MNCDLWIGSAPIRSHNEILRLKGLHYHYPKFRNYREYGDGGVLADMDAHHFDIAQWVNMDQNSTMCIEPPTEGRRNIN